MKTRERNAILSTIRSGEAFSEQDIVEKYGKAYLLGKIEEKLKDPTVKDFEQVIQLCIYAIYLERKKENVETKRIS